VFFLSAGKSKVSSGNIRAQGAPVIASGFAFVSRKQEKKLTEMTGDACKYIVWNNLHTRGCVMLFIFLSCQEVSIYIYIAQTRQLQEYM
jgi:hypothetical protein